MRVPHDSHAAPLLGAHLKDGASAYYRIALPVGAAGGVVAPFLAMTEPQVRAAEAVVVSRLGATPDARPERLRAVMRALREDAGRVVVDFDDDIFGQPAAYRHPEQNLEAAALMAREADAIVCTGPTLAARLRRLNRDVRVLPNYIRAADWPDPAPPADGPVTLVLAGSFTHEADWRIVAPALRRLRERHGVRLRVCGHLPAYLRDLCDDHRPWRGLAEYPAMLAGAHIGLAPLPDGGFNRCKSPIKAYEYALAGLAVVASPCQYGPTLAAAGLAAHVVPDGRDWTATIERLITDPAERGQAAAALRRHVIETLDVSRHTDTIRAAYAA